MQACKHSHRLSFGAAAVTKAAQYSVEPKALLSQALDFHSQEVPCGMFHIGRSPGHHLKPRQYHEPRRLAFFSQIATSLRITS